MILKIEIIITIGLVLSIIPKIYFIPKIVRKLEQVLPPFFVFIYIVENVPLDFCLVFHWLMGCDLGSADIIRNMERLQMIFSLCKMKYNITE